MRADERPTYVQAVVATEDEDEVTMTMDLDHFLSFCKIVSPM